MQEAWVCSLGREDPLEKEMATHSSILAWRIPWTEEPGGLQTIELWRVEHDWATSLYFTSSTVLQTSIQSSSGTLSDLITWIYLSLPLQNDA